MNHRGCSSAKLEKEKVFKAVEAEEPVINFAGEKVALGPFQEDLLPLMRKWLNDFTVSILSGDPLKPMTKEAVRAEYERLCHGDRPDYIGFALYERSVLRLIGLAELRQINMRNRTATYGILIGEKDCWNKGYGTEATMLMLDYGFNVLGLHNIMLDTYSYHETALRAYTRAGFKMVGRRREVHRWGNHLYDEVMMDCLASEFQRPTTTTLELR